MKQSIVRLSVQLAGALTLVACADPKPSAPERRPSPPLAAPHSPPPKAPAGPTAELPKPVTGPSAENAAPLTPPIDDSVIPRGPVFPPARANVALIQPPRGLTGMIYRAQRWAKDSVPAGEPHHFVRNNDDPASSPILRDRDPETLRAALDVNTPYRDVIAKILRSRSTNAITARLTQYLTAADPKSAFSAAELVVSDIFAGDRSARAKLVELGGGFDAIKTYGYYDEATAGRFEYLQARADQTYRRDRALHTLGAATFFVALPAVGAYTLVATRSPLIGRAGGLIVNAGEHAGAVGAAATRAWDRAIVPASDAIGERLKSAGLHNLYLKDSSLREIKNQIAIKGSVSPKVEFTVSGDPNLAYYEMRAWANGRLLPEQSVYAIRYKDGLRTKYAVTNYLKGTELEHFVGTLENLRPANLKVVDANGVVSTTDIPEQAIMESAQNFAATQPPRAIRRGPNENANVQLVDEPLDAAPGVSGTPANGEVYKKPRLNHVGGVVGGFVAGATIGIPYYSGYFEGVEEGVQFNQLYIGGQIDTNVQPPSAPVTSDLLTN